MGYYQPFCSLMFHGKIETRWVRKGKKPPFPLGRYFFYSTKKACENPTLFQWCGPDIMLSITQTLEGDITRFFNGSGLGFGDLVEVRLLTKEDEPKAFVKFKGERVVQDKNFEIKTYVQWALIFENLERVTPFTFDHGKQGVGFLKQPYLSQLGY